MSWDAAENAEQISVTKGMKRKGTFQIQYDSESMRNTQWLSISMLTSSKWMGNWIDSCCLINVSLVVLLRQNRSSKPRTLVKSNKIFISKSYRCKPMQLSGFVFCTHTSFSAEVVPSQVKRSKNNSSRVLTRSHSRNDYERRGFLHQCDKYQFYSKTKNEF